MSYSERAVKKTKDLPPKSPTKIKGGRIPLRDD